jgi:hypothetical protein
MTRKDFQSELLLARLWQASSASPLGRDAAIDFGASRLSLLPALDSYEDAMWRVLTDRFGKRNNCRIQAAPPRPYSLP